MLQIFWNEGGELLCISTDESFFILKYNAEAVENASPEDITEDGIEAAFDVCTWCMLHLHCYHLEECQQ